MSILYQLAFGMELGLRMDALAAIEIRVNKLHFAVEQYLRRETKAINVSRRANEEVVSVLRKKI